MNKKVGKILTAAAAGAAVGVAVKKLQDSRKEKEDERIAAIAPLVPVSRMTARGSPPSLRSHPVFPLP